MALKIKDIRKMKTEELNKKLRELKLELMKELANVKMGRPIKNPGKIRSIKKSIARILTVLNERKKLGG
ncbi:MAG: 50S ribosomal protein L29 [Candidatus Aenigmarchaeota archaeon ex4484_224]|nr:MAG: 50S ribosomal protein L29 [Candidatus Aenigmarchaeota archaeon ex4484_224]